jgi:hypothetical protein
MKKIILTIILTLFYTATVMADVIVNVEVSQTAPVDSTNNVITKVGVNKNATFSATGSYTGQPPLNTEEKVTSQSWKYVIYADDKVTCNKSSGDSSEVVFTASASNADNHPIKVEMTLTLTITKYLADMTTEVSKREVSYTGDNTFSLNVWNKLSISTKQYIPLKSTLNPDRYPVTITAETAQNDGQITITATNGIKLFENNTGGTGSTSYSWSASTTSKTIYMQGFTTSVKENDQTLTATCNSSNYQIATANVTVVEVDISANRWLVNGSLSEEVVMTYDPSDVKIGSLELRGNKDLFGLSSDSIGIWVLPLNWDLQSWHGSITIYAKGKTIGDGKLAVTHSTSGAKAEVETGVYGVDVKIDNVDESKEVTPGAFLAVAKRKSIKLIAEPKSRGGNVALERLGTKLKLYDAETGGNEITTRNWNVNQIPPQIYVEGTSISDNMQDQEVKLTWDTLSDNAKVTIINGQLMPKGLFPVTDKTGEGAYVHWNIDNDDNSSTVASESVKHPGGDYKQNHVVGENDLNTIALDIAPFFLNTGVVKLTIGSNAKLWKSKTKGTSKLITDTGEKSWNLDSATQKAELQNLVTSLYVEGINSGDSDFKFEFIPPAGSTIELDKVKYHFIAANCGMQPKFSTITYSVYDRASDKCVKRRGIEKNLILGSFPLLNGCEWSIIGQVDKRYNCIAYSVGITDRWIVGDEKDYYSKGLESNVCSIDWSYGNRNGILEDHEIHNFFEIEKDVTPTATGESDAEIIYYSGFHGAKRRNCSCGNSKWFMFESKCGIMWTLEHRAKQIGGDYGTPKFYYKKK